MPPEGYETITLPSELVAELDEYASDDSRAQAIRTLLEAQNADSVELDAGTINDIANETSNQVVRELENTLR